MTLGECRSPRGSVDRNSTLGMVSAQMLGRSPRGSVDRNYDKHARAAIAAVAPHAGAWIETFVNWLNRNRSRSLPTRERGSKRDQ